ncbi:MAG: AGE family epimerase/isomerase, partial [Candidatus Omnitrophica bacterium]|nr:AGE family epimerase/isomerase [Candidatus Omnitrophota bacterium]
HAAGRCELPEIWVTILEALQGSLSLGWDHDEDGLFYFIDADGKPPRQLEWSMKLWWPHTEALYALALAFTLTGDHSFEQWHQRIHEYAFTRFADEVDGEWFGYCDRYGKVTHRLKGGDYKGCFHVPRALLYTVKVLERL